MFATVHPTPPSGAAPAGAIEVAHLDGSGSTTIAFWPDEQSAPAGERVYRLVDRTDGPAAGRTPLFAQVGWVNSAGNPAVAEAAERGGRERIDPAIRDVEGLVGVLVFRSADHRIVVVGTATDLETHTEVSDRIQNTPLLPGEDRALLPGLDRAVLGRVVRADIPQAVRS
ncbi:hypothetical protein [Petropleomorpha daqingensis]|uniref:Uncharacterized protein n=1 Tax=Petropleomorpha daqingensis TaxID=2026353 RepID=A0A853CMJ8_9ACTN|nr:hypothetical protein [Petropleomorpha daqingensis]NYJ08950.1 hypothetical protein [Petropleomorpha daqingensis]